VSCWEFDHEGGAGDRVVFPGGDASGFACKASEWKLDERCEASLDRNAASGFVNQVEVLVEPDRHDGAEAADESVGDPCFGLGERAGAGVVDAGQRVPVPWEVAVEIDAVCVAACAASRTVGIEVGNDPEVDACRGWECPQASRDRLSGAFVAVNAANDRIFRGLVGSPASIPMMGRPSTDRPRMTVRRVGPKARGRSVLLAAANDAEKVERRT
jgi:hypothetical protein